MRRGVIDITLILFVVVVVFAIYLSGGVDLSKAYQWADTTPTPSPVTSSSPSPSASPSATVTTTVTPSPTR